MNSQAMPGTFPMKPSEKLAREILSFSGVPGRDRDEFLDSTTRAIDRHLDAQRKSMERMESEIDSLLQQIDDLKKQIALQP